MQKELWKFNDQQGSFTSETADKINSLYFPLCNSRYFMSSISPNLHGDAKTNFNSFLLEPASRIGLSNNKAGRNFWVYLNPQKIWSAAGVSKSGLAKDDKFKLEAGLLWQKITRSNAKVGLKAEITCFVPASGEPLEILSVKITNISRKSIKFTPTLAVPIYGRSANNLHDHRHVTSLLNRIELTKSGVVMTPTLFFDESGHHKNHTSYFVLGVNELGQGPEYIYPTQESFLGDAADLEAPEAIFEDLLPEKTLPIQGKEAMGALRFKAKTLAPGKSATYIGLLGIAENKKLISGYYKKFNTPKKIERALIFTKVYWQKINTIYLKMPDDNFANWFRWVSTQPLIRRIYGCSFLPDFDYGRGGRGWRDLWQDCLSLILTQPKETRQILINNFSGVRIDGSNATIIGQKCGEFLADRNNISRVWMDHGAWPFITTLLYIHQTGDFKILMEETSYFRDHQLCRSKEKDLKWQPQDGKELKTKNGRTYQGTVLEHILIQNLVQFFNVGVHNHMRLENADWNDALDLAAKHGESVALSALYAQNFVDIAYLLEKSGLKEISLLKEIAILVDSQNTKVNYNSVAQKHRLLKHYLNATKLRASGEKISISTEEIAADLRKKSAWINGHIQKTEWLKQGFFNGYYNNGKERVEGKIKGALRMTLTGQVFAIMSGIAQDCQTKQIFRNACRYLKNKNLPGFRLNTDFGEEQLNLGRAFSFVYGDKENGAYFSHMSVMFAYALYKQEFVQEGFSVLDGIYQMAIDSNTSKIYPCLPEYFNAQGRGMYSYLTGSASWFVLTFLTQVLGIKGVYGDLVIEPKLTKAQFAGKDRICLNTTFADKQIEVSFNNPHQKDFGHYSLKKVSINGKVFFEGKNLLHLKVPRKEFLRLTKRKLNKIEILLD